MSKINTATMAEHGLLDWAGAADYTGLTQTYFRRLTDRGMGPRRIRPSQNLSLFRTADLDAWMASWSEGGVNDKKRPR
jgi:predicted DNA-binding transcriptional regulator AlpA